MIIRCFRRKPMATHNIPLVVRSVLLWWRVTPFCKLADTLSDLGCQCWFIKPEEENDTFYNPIDRPTKDGQGELCPGI